MTKLAQLHCIKCDECIDAFVFHPHEEHVLAMCLICAIEYNDINGN